MNEVTARELKKYCIKRVVWPKKELGKIFQEQKGVDQILTEGRRGLRLWMKLRVLFFDESFFFFFFQNSFQAL